MARTRSRKRRPTGAKRAPASPKREATATPKRKALAARTSPTAPTYGVRPNAPWHPLPLSEILILVGAVAAAIGFARSKDGFSNGGPAVLAGIAAVAIGTVEVTLREHLSGYRSHTIMLALIPVLIFHSAVILGLAEVTSVPRLLNVGLFAIDIAMFAVLFKLLRARFLGARHARVIREG
jgi:hypothetical protein